MIRVSAAIANREIDEQEHGYQQLKTAIHEELVESLDLATLGRIDEERLGPEVRSVAEQLCRHRKGGAGVDQDRLLNELMDEVFGLGPLERLVKDDSVADILVNDAHEVYVERNGKLELTDVIFSDDRHVMRVIQRIVSRIGRRIDEVSPMVDARLPDGSRINAIVPPLALRGPTLSIRRFGKSPLTTENLVHNQSILPEMVEFLSAAVESRMSFLISGGTGAGKTTLLNALSAFVPESERLVTIEDSAELNLLHKHVVPLETRNPNTEDKGEVSQRDLVRNALRMRPDRILIGEVRSAEALDMLQAMNTGHEGSLCTIHANDTRDALARLEMMTSMAGYEFPTQVIRQYISAGIRLVVHLARLRGGIRRVTRISEIRELKDGQYDIHDIFGFKQDGVDESGAAYGHFFVTGYVPQCLERMRESGRELPSSLFEQRDIIAS